MMIGISGHMIGSENRDVSELVESLQVPEVPCFYFCSICTICILSLELGLVVVLGRVNESDSSMTSANTNLHLPMLAGW